MLSIAIHPGVGSPLAGAAFTANHLWHEQGRVCKTLKPTKPVILNGVKDPRLCPQAVVLLDPSHGSG
jgi:hypothetical protein